MEYYGKILCITVDDLTRDDRMKWHGVEPNPNNPYAPIMTMANYKQLKARNKINVVRPGKGSGSYALIEVSSLPERFRARIKGKYGEVKSTVLRDWFGQHYKVDVKAREFFSYYRFSDGSMLPPEHIQEYTTNASVLQAVIALMNDTRMLRKVMQNAKINWGEMSGAISFYQEEFRHTLPLSPNRFAKRVKEFKETGYVSLISKKFANQNTRKVTWQIEQLILSLDSLPERPYNTTVAKMYHQFIHHEIDVCDPHTGELYNPNDYLDENGNTVELSETTIANILTNPKNLALRAKLHSTYWDFNNEYRPHHLRHSPIHAFSKVSLDDRDLPRKMANGSRVHAYYAGDVASGCIIGYAYNKLKDKDLFIDCMRNMFQTIDKNGWCVPAQVEVEHHLVNNFADGLMKAGIIFPLVRWCIPGNSQEKREEHINRAKKYSIEKLNQVNIGRWYSALEANRPKIEKIYDEFNNTYKEKTYSYEELVADDIRSINEYNSMLHPNQKRYPGMSRWAVLCSTQNPNLSPIDKAVLYKFIGEHTKTTIRRNMYCKVQYKEYRLPTPDLIAKLDPRNYEVDAYYLADSEGNINEVYLYQNDKYIAECACIDRYNEATCEQTDSDTAAYTEQAKYVSQFDAMIKKDKIQKVIIINKEESNEIANIAAKPINKPFTVTSCDFDDEDYSEYMDVSKYKAAAFIDA